MLGRNEPKPVVSMKGIYKSFGQVRVLEDIDFEVYPGEVHILAGENGAGKSTLIKILSGVHTDYEGEIFLDGKAVHPSGPLEANHIGISVIHQELSSVPSMSVKDNLFLGRPVTKLGFIRERVHKQRAVELLEKMGLSVDCSDRIEDLPISVQQLIEIAKAVSLDAKVIIMDEPSSALNAQDVEILFDLIAKLKMQGCGIVYISHRMEEIERIADRITVLRDGKLIGSVPAVELPMPKLLNWMVGRDIDEQFPRHMAPAGRERLRVEDFSVRGHGGKKVRLVDGVNLSVKSGEILGIAGLQGSGASDLLTGIFGGSGKAASGRIFLDGEKIKISKPRDAINRGIGLLTNDRKATGLVLSMSIISNICMAGIRDLTRAGWRNPEKERAAAVRLGETLRLKTVSYDHEVGVLSGGNQQKAAIAKWLQLSPVVLLLDEPTRGVDVGAKHEIYQLMNEWTAEGISIILITSEMPELLAMSDRILVMHRGKITAEFQRDEADAERILEAAMGKEMIDV